MLARVRALGLVTLASLGACAAPAPPLAAPPRAAAPAPAPQAPASAGAQYFHGVADDAFWVTHDAGRDRIVAGGARLELDPAGRVLAAAWEEDLWAMGDGVLGSLAVAPHLGGGFVHWSKTAIFRSTEFTGPLERIALGMGGATVRGARNALEGVAVFTDAGPRLLRAGAMEAGPLQEPAMFDVAALDAARAVRVDVLGRAETTADGGKTWRDVAVQIGLSARGLSVGPDEIGIDTWQGRAAVAPDGSVGAPDGDFRRGFSSNNTFQLIFEGTRATEREDFPWAWRETSPLVAAAVAGAPLRDGTALVLAQSGAARVDLRTGAALSVHSDWLPSGLACAPVSVADGVLLVCTWDEYQGYGAYVLRTAAGEPPVTERVFSDSGYFVADDRGAVGFVGSCRAVPRILDEDDPQRGGRWGEVVPAGVLCVRRAPGDWVERRVDLDAQRALVAWAPRRDGTAVALVKAGNGREALPEAVGAPRVTEEGGVRVVQLVQELSGWYWTRPTYRAYGVRGAPQVLVDRRFQARDDGSVDGWLSPEESPDAYARVGLGATIAADGRVTVHPLPANAAGMVTGGSFGLVATRGGELFETVDHGRSFQRVGRSPVPPSAFEGVCSPIGCALGPVVRLGWGRAALSPAVTADPDAACRVEDRWTGPGDCEEVCSEASRRMEARDPPPKAPVLSCAPVGLPEPRPPVRAEGDGKLTVETAYGDEVVIVRETSEPEPEPPPPYGQAPVPPPAGSAATPAAPAKATAPALRTHALLFRPLFDPSAPLLRLNATNTTLNMSRSYRRISAVPLLGPRGEVHLLILADGSEMLVGPADVTTLPPFDTRRYYSGQAGTTGGLLLGPGRAAVLGDARRRTVIEEHGPDPQRPPLAIGLERDQTRRRPMTLARRDDGAIGVLVLDGDAPETAGAARIDASGVAGPAEPLAPWSTLTEASDPRCRSQKGAWRALLVLDPTTALRLDPQAYPRVSFGDKGIARVRWGRERACLEAVDLAVLDGTTVVRLIARWGDGGGGASAVGPVLAQPLACTLARPIEQPMSGNRLE